MSYFMFSAIYYINNIPLVFYCTVPVFIFHKTTKIHHQTLLLSCSDWIVKTSEFQSDCAQNVSGLCLYTDVKTGIQWSKWHASRWLVFHYYPDVLPLVTWGWNARPHRSLERKRSSPREWYLLHLSLRFTFFWHRLVSLSFHPYLDCLPSDLPHA